MSAGVMSELDAMSDSLGLHRSSSWAWYHEMGRPRVWLAPLVGYSDVAFRLLARSCGADVCHTQMIDAGRACRDEAYARSFFAAAGTDLAALDRPLIAQLGGGDPEEVGAAAAVLARVASVDGIELNMGCPQQCAKKGGYGAFLMEDVNRATACVSAIRAALVGLNSCGTLCKI